MDDLRFRLALDGADQIQANANRAAQAMEGLGARTAQAGQRAQLSGQQMAQVSAQLQDLFVQIQAGGSPVTALIQQGSQLSSVFGGVGNALRGVASLITPAVAVMGSLAAVVGVTAAAYAQGSKEADEYRKAIVLSGNAAGVTVGQLQDMARAQAALVGTQGRAAEVLTVLASSGTVAAAQMQAATDAAIRLERVGGPAAEETAKKFARLGQDPVKALAELNKAENFLTESLYRQVQALAEQGRTAEAAALAQSTYAAEVQRRAETLTNSLGSLERGWATVKDAAKAAAKAAWDAMLGIGRAETPQQRLQGTITALAEAQAKLDAARAGNARLPGLDTDRIAAAQERRVRSLEAEVRFQQILIAQDARRGASANEAARAVNETITAEEKAQQARTRIARDAQAQQERDNALRLQAVGLSADYTKSLTELASAKQRGVLNEEQYLAAVQKVVAAQPVMVAYLKEQQQAEQDAAKAIEAHYQAYERQLLALRKSADSVADQVQKLRDEEQAAGIAAAQNITLAEAIQQVAIARLQEQQARSQDLGEVSTLQAEIDARRELITLMRSGDLRDASKRSADDAARDWQRASQDIERSLTDALLRGFESGKDFGRVLVDTLKNLFSTLVLRPLIQPVVGALAGSLGLAGAANAAGAAGGLSSLSSLSTLGGLLSSGSLLGNTLSVSGGLLGLGELSTLGIGEAFGGGLSALLGGNIGGGLSTLTGAALPFIGGAALIGNALGLFRSNRQVGAGITGQLGGTVEDFVVNRRGGSLFSGPSYSTPTTGVSSLNADLQATFNGLRQNAAAMAQALGLSATAALTFTTAIGSDKLSDDTGGQGIRLEGLSAEQVTAKLQAELTAANERLAQSVLGTAASAFTKTGETAAQTLERLAGSITGVNGVLGVLGQSLLAVSTSGADTASKLLDQFGGLQQFQAASGQYLADYYTEAERTALATQQLTQQLAGIGLAVPASREAYRQLVEAQDLNTESGRKAYAALLQLAPSFAQLVPAVTDLGNAAAEAARLAEQAAEQQREAGRRVLADLAREGVDLQVELLRAQGQGAAAAELARQQALAGLTEGLSSTDAAAVAALFDLNAARRAEIDALLATQEAARAAAAQRDSLTQRLLQLQGDTTALRERELAALDPANRALQQQINALLDQQSAAQQAAQALQAFQGVLDNLASQRGDLEVQLLQAQGKTAEADALQRQQALARLTAGLTAEQAAQVTAAYDYNTALQRQIQATTDAAQAAQQLAADQARAASEAERAAEAIRSAWQSAADSLFDEAARIRGLIAGQGGGLTLAQAQAQFAIATGQARAGDQDAARSLPGLSQTLLDLATANAGSLLELNRIRAAIAASLEGTGKGLAGLFGLQVPKLATGTAYVPRDMLALLHEGEAVVPKPFNPAAGGSSSGAEVAAAVRRLDENQQAQSLAMVQLQTRVARLLERWDASGIPEERDTA